MTGSVRSSMDATTPNDPLARLAAALETLSASQLKLAEAAERLAQRQHAAVAAAQLLQAAPEQLGRHVQLGERRVLVLQRQPVVAQDQQALAAPPAAADERAHAGRRRGSQEEELGRGHGSTLTGCSAAERPW